MTEAHQLHAASTRSRTTTHGGSLGREFVHLDEGRQGALFASAVGVERGGRFRTQKGDCFV